MRRRIALTSPTTALFALLAALVCSPALAAMWGHMSSDGADTNEATNP
jgi:hypothetical protein